MDIKLVNARKKVTHLSKWMHAKMRILDFGCGDLSFAKELFRIYPSLDVTGVDVVDFKVRADRIHFRTYDGKKLPFKTRQFDAVISWHVLHHTETPFVLLKECSRVSKNYIFLVEPVYRSILDIPGMILMDWIFNVWKNRSISMAYRFYSKQRWLSEIRDIGWICDSIIDVELLPDWFPAGRSLLFVCRPLKRLS